MLVQLRSVRWVIRLPLLVALYVAGQAVAAEKPSVDDILNAFATYDIRTIRNVLDVTSTLGRPDVRSLLLDLWYERRDARAEIPWDIVKAPQIRIRIARILVPVAQKRRGRLEAGILDYAWSQVNSPDDSVGRDAFGVIGPIAQKADIDRIEQYLTDGSLRTNGGFFGAVWALAERCGSREVSVLDALQARETDRKRVNIIVDARKQWDEQKKKYGLCR